MHLSIKFEMTLHHKTLCIDLGLAEYKQSWDYQEQMCRQLQKAVLNGSYANACNYLLFVEHPHVYTLGKNGKPGNLLVNSKFLNKIGASFCMTNRGGDITYHGPGQIVVYPLFYLEAFRMGVRQYIENLEEAVIRMLNDYQIKAMRMPDAIGVWLEADTPAARKICAIGVRVSRGISMHGLALNVNTQLEYFNYIHPCGFVDKGVTSMEKELHSKVDINEVKEKLREKLVEVFDLEFV